MKVVMYLAICAAAATLLVAPAMATTLLSYQMDEGSGSAVADSSGNARNAVMSADLAAQSGNWVAGHSGTAVHFEQAVSKNTMINWYGASDWSNAMLLGDSTEFTVDTWIKPSGFAADEYLFAIGDGIGSTVSIRWDPSLTANATSLNKLTVYTYSGGHMDSTISLSSPIQAGVWQQLTLVYRETGESTARYEIYKNGIEIGRSDLAYQIDSNPNELHIGQVPTGVWYRSYRGDVDEFSISVVPEPITLSILGLGGLFLARRSNRS